MRIDTRWLAYSAAVALATGGVTNPIRAQVVVNGGFEAPAVAPGNFLTINPGQEVATGFTGWTVTAGNIDVVNTSVPILGISWSPGSIDGTQLLDLNGTTAGAIAQTLATSAGLHYQLSFSYANNPGASSSPHTATLAVTDVGTGFTLASQPFSHTTSTNTSPDWVTQSFFFTATGATSQLTFTSTSGVGDPSGGVVLDAVSVSPVPEPTSLAFAAMGALGLVIRAMRRHRRNP